MQKLIHVDAKSVPAKLLYAFAKNPHDGRLAQQLPMNWAEVTAEQAAHRLHCWSPEYIYYNQCIADYEGTRLAKMIDPHFYIFDDGTGLALCYDHWPAAKATWYSFGCTHNYERLPDDQYKIWGPHSKCTHCGIFYTAPDSSG